MMYRQYYGMNSNPFDKELETKNAYLTQDMKAMQGRLDYLKNHPGIGLFTAASGQGKTFALSEICKTCRSRKIEMKKHFFRFQLLV